MQVYEVMRIDFFFFGLVWSFYKEIKICGNGITLTHHLR